MNKYQLVIFDLDGMLLDTSAGSIKSIEYTVQQMGLAIPDAHALRSFIGPPIYESLMEHYGMDRERALEGTEIFRNAYKDIYLFEATPYEKIYELLDLLREAGYKTAVATNKRDDYAKRLLEHYRFTPRFDYILGSDMASTMKKADIVKACLDALKIPSEYAVLLGDTVHDAVGAKMCGIDFIGVTYGFGYQTKAEVLADGAVAAADSCSDLVEILL